MLTTKQKAIMAYSASDLISAGYSASDLISAGYSASDLISAGYSASDLKSAGYSASDLISAGYSASDLKSAGYSASSLKSLGYSASALKSAGYSASDLKSAGCRASDLISAGYSASDLKSAGYSASALKSLEKSIPLVDKPYSKMWSNIKSNLIKHDQITFGPDCDPTTNLCKTAMCTAGHLVNMGGAMGYALKEKYDSFAIAASLIHYKAHPYWPCQNFGVIPQENALAYIETMAIHEENGTNPLDDFKK
jgi:hypothetical protein